MIFESTGRIASSIATNWEAKAAQGLSVLITNSAGTFDYAKALTGNPVKKVQKLQDVCLLDFSIAALEVFELPPPSRGDYVVFSTAEYGVWFTGYISAEPTQTISGKDSIYSTKHWQYDIEVNSDEWILNLQALPINLVYQNTTAGTIIQDLAERILPGTFDYSNIQAGPVVAKYVVDPARAFSDVVKDLAQNAFYNFYSQSKALFFFPIDQTDQNVVVDGDDKHFTPANLQISPSTDPIVNDVTVVGMVEPQGKMTEYFIGDGITGKFNLTAGCYGVAEETLLDETFGNSMIDPSVWTVFDSPLDYLQVSNGYLNCLGGYNDGSYGIRLVSNDLFPLENNIRITHGQWDFVSQSTGILGGIYFDLPQAPVAGVFHNLLFGIQASPSTARQSTGTVLNPVVNGVPDPSQYLTVTDYFNVRVTCRTILKFTNPVRSFFEYGYISGDGTVGSNTSPLTPDTVTINTFLAVIDINTGAIRQSVNWTNTTTVTAEQTYAYYAPIVSDNLNVTVTGITVSRPIQAVLDVKSLKFPTYTLNAPGGDIQFASDRGYFIGQSLQPIADFTITARIDSLTNIGTSKQRAGLMYRYRYDTQPNPVYNSANDGMVCILISAAGVVSLRYRDALGGPVKEVGTLDQNNGQTDGITLPQYFQLTKTGGTYVAYYSSDGSAWTTLASVSNLTPFLTKGPMVVGCVVTGEEYNTIEQVTAVFQEVQLNKAPIVIDTKATLGTALVPTWPLGYETDTVNWTSEHLGVNELDTLDGLAPVATVIEQSTSVQKNANLRGSFQYNPGQCQLDYFNDATTQTSTVPDVGDLVRLTYNRAGTAIARVVNGDSILQEAESFGDSGHRKQTVINLSPQPRTSDECAAAASATIQSSGYQHFTGTYTQYDPFGMIGEPRAGAVLPFANLSADIPGLQAEIIQQVTTTLLSVVPKENYQHVIQFGNIDWAKRYVNRLGNPQGAPMPNDVADVPKVVDLDIYDLSILQPISSVELVAWDKVKWTFQVNDVLNVGEGIEVRSSDDSWGCDSSRNLIYRGTNQTITTPRTTNGRLIFVRRYDNRNIVPFSEDLTQWAATSATVANTKQANPDGDVSLISNIVAQQGATASIGLNVPLQVTTLSPVTRSLPRLLVPSPQYLAPGSVLRGGPYLFPPTPQTYKVPVTTGVSAVSIKAMLNGPVGAQVQIDLAIQFPVGWGVDSYGVNPYGSPADTLSNNPSTSITLGAGWTTFEWDSLVLPAGASGASLQFTFLSAGTVQITRVQVEPAAGTTLYCKTNGGPYGALSRYSYGVRANVPLVPPAPSGSVDISDPLNPVITLNLPADETNVWGAEIRDADNKTVLFSSFFGQANFGVGYDMNFTYANNKVRNHNFYLYTFNLLGEYSTYFSLGMNIPSPVVSNVTFDDSTLSMSWDAFGATSFEVIVQKIIEVLVPPGHISPLVVAGASSYTIQPISGITVTGRKQPGATTDLVFTQAQKLTLKSADYFNERFITIIPSDNMGPADNGVFIDHIYAPPITPTGPDQIIVVKPPQGPVLNPVLPPFGPIQGRFVAESWKNYQTNLGIAPQITE